MTEGNAVFLPERLESEEASSNHHGKVAAVRDHCTRTGLLGIFASLRGVRFSKTQLFTRCWFETPTETGKLLCPTAACATSPRGSTAGADRQSQLQGLGVKNNPKA